MTLTSDPIASSAARVISSTIDQDELTINNNIYIFEKKCDLSVLQNSDLSNSTLCFEGSVDLNILKKLDLTNATLIFQNGKPNVSRVPAPAQPMPMSGSQKKLTKGQKKLALQSLREDRSDAELAASMSTKLEDIEHAIHPERLALLQPAQTVKLEDATSTSGAIATTTKIVEEPLLSHNELPDALIKAELEEGEILDNSNMNPALTSADSIDLCSALAMQETTPSVLAPCVLPEPIQHSSGSDFVRADLKRHGILATPAAVDAVATSDESEPPPKRVRFELPQKPPPSPCPCSSPFIKCEGD